MTTPTKTFTTPTTQIPFEIYEWITGRKADYIQEPILSAMKIGGNMAGGSPEITMNQEKSTSGIQLSAHRKIESYVAKLGEETDKTKILATILDEMPESDRDFIESKIVEMEVASKKK
ncbi:MAG: hypothetical protein WAV09_04250 [Minisyncoccia bacterium]